jgi:hypothetical protein
MSRSLPVAGRWLGWASASRVIVLTMLQVLNAPLWDAVNAFAIAANMSVVFGVNAGLGPRGGDTASPWSPANAMTL